MFRHFHRRSSNLFAFLACVVLFLGPAAALGQCGCDYCGCAASSNDESCCCLSAVATSCCEQVALPSAPQGCSCQAEAGQTTTALPQNLQRKYDSEPLAFAAAPNVEISAVALVLRPVPAAAFAAAIPRYLLFC